MANNLRYIKNRIQINSGGAYSTGEYNTGGEILISVFLTTLYWHTHILTPLRWVYRS